MIIGLFHGYGAAGYYQKFGRVTEFLIASLCFYLDYPHIILYR